MSANLPSSTPCIKIPYSDSNTPTRRRQGRNPMEPSSRSSTSISPIDLRNHLYLSLLEGRTADVALRVRGTWEAVYRLHRVILIQAGFFRSLFTSGFSESAPKAGHRYLGPDIIEVVFDDRNITRAAFELCIARLYGGGPPLHISPSLIPTPSKPLTPSFPCPLPQSDLPPGHHPATPRFLLSLLATAVYLSIPSTASQALSLILSSVGPRTATEYLNFAIGKPIQGADELEPKAAVGLESLAEEIQEPSSYAASARTPSVAPNVATDALQEKTEELSRKLEDLNIKKEDPSVLFSDESEVEVEYDEPYFHYGAVSDKIGETTACWLARWGTDILVYEERTCDFPPSVSGSKHLQNTTKCDIPAVWDRGGLNRKWVRALVSSDTLFVKGERERYEFAKRVIDLRRRSGIDPVEEEEWTLMFSTGIYYAHMSLDDIITLSRDVSPITGKPYVPLSVLQAGHWNQALLRHHITAKPFGSAPGSPSASPPPFREQRLGLAVTTADILSTLPSTSATDVEKEKVYYPIPSDSSIRLGDSGGIDGTSMDQLFELSSHTTDAKTGSRLTTCESNFFGLLFERQTAPSCITSDPTGKSQWSAYPPFRFAVEFWDIDSLKEMQRLHSHTVWYAGSLFNVYVQVIRKKGVQLGLYLHRQSSIDPIPPSSFPATTRAERTYNRGSGSLSPSFPTLSSSTLFHYSPSIHPSSPPRCSTPISSPTTATTSQSAAYAGTNSIPATAPPVSPPSAYRDSRPIISAYFKISCASATGAALTRFTSAPDIFSVSQSWGWKSSSLRTEEYLEVGPEGDVVPKLAGPAGREVSLRATVVVGLV